MLALCLRKSHADGSMSAFESRILYQTQLMIPHHGQTSNDIQNASNQGVFTESAPLVVLGNLINLLSQLRLFYSTFYNG
jgi:adenylosuccinate lyase